MTEREAFDPQRYIRRLTTRPGVYRMLDGDGEALYVGKARNLKKRVASYFLRASGNPRIESMVEQIRAIEVTITDSEDEALLLESSLIKSLKPRYNVCLRDDKSYPYLRVTRHRYPRLVFHRGARRDDERHFGPFPSAATVRETISMLQKVFQLRDCSDSYFANRSRPCLQHQIGRCTAPCVGRISAEGYQRDVQRASDVLSGRTGDLIAELQAEMDRQSEALDFEAAARTRDRIAAIRRMQEQRVVTGLAGDADFVVMERISGLVGFAILSVRSGQNRGQRQHFPKVPEGIEDGELMASFLAQHYSGHELPAELIVSHAPDEADWLSHALTSRAGHRVRIKHRVREVRRRLLALTARSLREAMKHRLLSRQGVGQRLLALQQRFALDAVPERIECFDISHSQGEATVASCVVFTEEGPANGEYRRFNIEGITGGDDYAAMRQVIERRYRRVQAEEQPRPDVILIDGGAGQLKAAADALAAIGIEIPLLLGVAKGVSRKPGLEQLFMPGMDAPLRLEPQDPALLLIQQVRDEAHRFAITGHRGRRGRARQRSELQEISGLGPKRRSELLRAFGGLRQLRRASREDIGRVPGFSRELAGRVYDHLHEST